MSYKVIARRWRSKNFSELIGQDAISQTLLNALRSNRLPHALLLTGPRGTGKTSTARILAKSLRCTKSKDFVPCGSCDECQDIESGRSVDVIEIDGASNNGVDAVRELRDTVGFLPSHGSKKLYIIDEVHMLSTSAFNALLKTLEEPPPHVVFVLATTEVQKIPETILSRCQRFDFRRIATRQIAEHLEHICKVDQIPYETDALWSIARYGSGSMRDAQSLLDQVLAFSEGKITTASTTTALGLTDRTLLLSVLKSLVERDTKKALDAIKNFTQSGLDPRVFLNELIEEIRHLLFAKIGSDQASTLIDLPDSEIQALQQLGSTLSAEDIHLLFDMAVKGAHDLSKYDEVRIVLEMLVLRMAAAPRIQNLLSITSPAPTLNAVTPSAQVPAGTSVHRPAPTPRTNVSPSTPTKTSEPDIATPVTKGPQQWVEFVNRVKAVNGLVGAQLENTFLKSLQGQTVTIGVPQKLKFLHAKLQDGEFQRKISNYLQTFWGQDMKLKIELDEGDQTPTPKFQEEKKRQDEDALIRNQVENHPLVKATQSIFKSQIGTIKSE